jgi:hypothetical protein
MLERGIDVTAVGFQGPERDAAVSQRRAPERVARILGDRVPHNSAMLRWSPSGVCRPALKRRGRNRRQARGVAGGPPAGSRDSRCRSSSDRAAAMQWPIASCVAGSSSSVPSNARASSVVASVPLHAVANADPVP